MSTWHYFYEGECEKKLIEALKKESLVKPGRLMKHNFWNQSFGSKIRLISRGSTGVIVFDTDDCKNHSTFVENVLSLRGVCRDVILLAQHDNLEGELCYSCGIKGTNSLARKMYGTTSLKDLKKRLIRESNLYSKLQSNGFDIDKIWTREDIYSGCLSCLRGKTKLSFGQSKCRK